MDLKPKFVHTYKREQLYRYLFVIALSGENDIFFYTFDDLSGFGTEWAMNAHNFIIMGTAIITYKDFIKSEVKKHLND